MNVNLESFSKGLVDYSRGVMLFRGVLLIALGVLMFSDFTAIVNMVTMILGIVLLVDGAATLFGMLVNRKTSVSLVASSLFLIVFGIIALKKPIEINMLIMIAIGVWVAMSAVQEIIFCVTAKRPVLSLLSGILSLVIGVLFVISPWSGLAAIGNLLGVLLLISGVTTVSTAIILGQSLK